MSRAVTLFLAVITLGLAILLSLLGLATIQSNLLGWFLLISGLIYFFGTVIVYWIRRIRFWRPRASGEMVGEERNDRSFWFIAVSMISVFYLSPVEYLLFKAVLPRVVCMQVVGLLLIFWGSVLFIWARRTLGDFYSGHVAVVEGQPLEERGPYHFIRHPAYAGYVLISFGIVLGYSSLLGITAFLFILLPAVVYRIRVEDKLLAEQFGSQFDKYTQRTKRLFPGIW